MTRRVVLRKIQFSCKMNRQKLIPISCQVISKDNETRIWKFQHLSYTGEVGVPKVGFRLIVIGSKDQTRLDAFIVEPFLVTCKLLFKQDPTLYAGIPGSSNARIPPNLIKKKSEISICRNGSKGKIRVIIHLS